MFRRGIHCVEIWREDNSHHSEAVVVALLVHGLRKLFEMALANILYKEVGAVNMANTGGDLPLLVLIEVKRLDGALFAHSFGYGGMDRLSFVIVRECHGVWSRGDWNWERKAFLIDEKMKMGWRYNVKESRLRRTWR